MASRQRQRQRAGPPERTRRFEMPAPAAPPCIAAHGEPESLNFSSDHGDAGMPCSPTLPPWRNKVRRTAQGEARLTARFRAEKTQATSWGTDLPRCPAMRNESDPRPDAQRVPAADAVLRGELASC